jgi:hypothetical protein
MSQKMYTHKGGDDMQHWKSCKVLLYLNIILLMVLSLALMGCGDDSDHGEDIVTVNDTFALTADNAAALAGLSFDFPDGSIFGPECADVPATLEFGPTGDTFTLTCDGTTIDGVVTFGSCILESEEVGEYRQRFTTCDCNVNAQNIPPGGSTDGEATLSLGRPNRDTVTSDPTETVVGVGDDGSVTIGGNETPIGTASGSTGG